MDTCFGEVIDYFDNKPYEAPKTKGAHIHEHSNICHVHYKAISGIVKETAKEFKVPYHENKTFFRALKSHFTLLHHLGTGKYDSMRKAKIS